MKEESHKKEFRWWKDTKEACKMKNIKWSEDNINWVVGNGKKHKILRR